MGTINNSNEFQGSNVTVTPSNNPMNYNKPDTNPATVDIYGVDGAGNKQMNTFYWYKRALIEAKKDQYFGQMASTINMPKHMGQKIQRYVYVPLLDDRNINDQGIDATGAHIVNGNLYGSSKDVGKILSKLPVLGENGGRVNRVGFTRTTREGSMNKYGFFFEWSEDSLQFDSDPELYQHMYNEAIKGASEMTEDMLQIDLLNHAGVQLFPGDATSIATVSGEGSAPHVLTYRDLQKLDQVLTDNRCKYDTRIITGTRNIDTKVVPAARIAFIGSELALQLQDMVDNFGNPAFVSVEHYAAGTTVLRGEIGKIGKFRFVQVPEMEFFEGQGAAVTDTDSPFANDGSKYNVYPMLVVGDDAFNTIGFTTDGAHDKWKIMVKKPGMATADKTDPYGTQGFCSIQFWYGFLCNRPERIAVAYSVAQA